MSIYNSVLNKMPKGPANKVTGKWCAIRVCPDLAADEWLNVGVLFQDSTGAIHIKMLDYFERLKFLYDGLIPQANFSDLLENIESSLRVSGIDSLEKFFSPHARVGDMHYAAGDSVEGILRSFYDTVVTLGRPIRDLPNSDR